MIPAASAEEGGGRVRSEAVSRRSGSGRPSVIVIVPPPAGLLRTCQKSYSQPRGLIDDGHVAVRSAGRPRGARGSAICSALDVALAPRLGAVDRVESGRRAASSRSAGPSRRWYLRRRGKACQRPARSRCIAADDRGRVGCAASARCRHGAVNQAEELVPAYGRQQAAGQCSSMAEGAVACRWLPGRRRLLGTAGRRRSGSAGARRGRGAAFRSSAALPRSERPPDAPDRHAAGALCTAFLLVPARELVGDRGADDGGSLSTLAGPEDQGGGRSSAPAWKRPCASLGRRRRARRRHRNPSEAGERHRQCDLRRRAPLDALVFV